MPTDTRPAYDANCYLCPGNARAGGHHNPEYARHFVFTNDFPALLPDAARSSSADPLFSHETVSGTSRVVCFSPRHDLTLARMDSDEIVGVIDLLADQVSELASDFEWVQPFENRGAAMGASNPHPHGQIWAQSPVPGLAASEAQRQADYLDEFGRPLLADYLERELELADRVVVANDEWVTVVPYWAVWPFETLLVPRRPAADLPGLDAAQRTGLADVLRRTLVHYDNLFETSFPYSMGWHGRPYDNGNHPGSVLHVHFYPPLLRSATVRKFMVGYEMLGEPQRDLTAEQAATRLRQLPDRHYLDAAG